MRDDDSYMIDHYVISLAPSLAIFRHSCLAYQRQPNPQVVDTVQVPILSFGMKSFDHHKPVMSPLPFASAEAEAVAKLFGCTAAVGSATAFGKQEIMQELKKDPGILHFATHCISMPNKVDGALIVGCGDLLEVGDITHQQVHASLAVLSACNSAMGHVTSDGIISLAWALLGAGVTTVVASLWSVPGKLLVSYCCPLLILTASCL